MGLICCSSLLGIFFLYWRLVILPETNKQFALEKWMWEGLFSGWNEKWCRFTFSGLLQEKTCPRRSQWNIGEKESLWVCKYEKSIQCLDVTPFYYEGDTVDGRNPAPPNMHETLYIMRYLQYQQVQDFFHQQCHKREFFTKKSISDLKKWQHSQPFWLRCCCEGKQLRQGCRLYSQLTIKYPPIKLTCSLLKAFLSRWFSFYTGEIC